MIIKATIYRILSLVIATVFLTLTGFSGGETYTVKDPDTVKTNFTVLSDAHVETNNLKRYKVFSTVLQNVNRNENGNDAVVFLGDSTMNGQLLENLIFHGSISVLMPEQKVVPVMGNHDIGNGEGNYNILRNRWLSFTETFFGIETKTTYYYDIIDGSYFIALGMEDHTVNSSFISEEQFEWLRETLALAADSGKPAFIFSHYPARYMYDKDGNYGRLAEMLAEYNKENDVFYFGGHTHITFSSWSFRTDNGYPETWLPCLTSMDEDSTTGVGVSVEVYENEVVLRARNFLTGEWFTENGTPCEVTYQLKNPITG